MKKLPSELPILFRIVHKQLIKLNRLGSKQAKAKKYFQLTHGHAQNREPLP